MPRVITLLATRVTGEVERGFLRGTSSFKDLILSGEDKEGPRERGMFTCPPGRFLQGPDEQGCFNPVMSGVRRAEVF